MGSIAVVKLWYWCHYHLVSSVVRRSIWSSSFRWRYCPDYGDMSLCERVSDDVN